MNQDMDRTYNSMGSNVFFEFGKQEEFVFPNGKKGVQKEWCIWLSWTSWRISQYDRYIIASGEPLEVNIQTYLERLLGKRFRSFHFLSQFLDVEFVFEDGYKISTFFNYISENQWLVFLPDKTKISVDCSSHKEIKDIQNFSKQLEIENRYKFCSLVLNVEIQEILFRENEISKLICRDDFLIDLGSSAWRLENEGRYCIGRLDYYFDCPKAQKKELQDKVLELIGRKIKYVRVDSSRMDACLEFEGGYVLEVFTHASKDSWKIYHKKDIVLCASITA